MANYGIGIGAFIDGIQKGKAAAQAADEYDQKQKQQAFQNNLATNSDQRAMAADARAAATSQQQLSQGATTFQNAQDDRAANAPLLQLQRDAKKDELEGNAAVTDAQEQGAKDAGAAYDALKAKSIATGVDAQGNPTFFFNGQSVPDQATADKLFEQAHGTRMQNYYNVAAPKIQQAMLENGDVAKATAFGKAHQDADFQRGVDLLGRLEGHYQMGNWDGVNTELNNIIGNNGYMNFKNHDVSATPIQGPDGKTNGIAVSYKDNGTGEAHHVDFTDMAQLHATLSGLISPQAAIAHNQAQDDAARAAKLDAVKGQNKLANDITLANVNSANTISENTAKALADLPTKVQGKITDIYKNMNDNGDFPQVVGPDGKSRDMTADEKWAKAAQSYQAGQAALGFAPQIVPRGSVMPAQQPGQVAPPANRRGYYPATAQAAPAPTPAVRAAPAPQTPPPPPGPGSVSDYEARFNLGNVPDVGREPPFIKTRPASPYPIQGGEGVDDYARRLGIDNSPRPPTTGGATSNTPQGRSLDEYMRRLGLQQQ